LIRPETLIALQRALDAALGETAAEVLLAGGRAGGGRTAATLAGDVRERVTTMLERGGSIGWGQFARERLAARGLVVAVRDSPFAEAHGPSDRPVGHLTRGPLHALAESVFEGPVAVRETACAATGAACCRFEAALVTARAIIQRAVSATHRDVLVITVGLSLALRSAAGLVWTHEEFAFPSVLGDRRLALGPVRLAPGALGIIGASLFLMGLLWALVTQTRLGRAMRAVAQNQSAARFNGFTAAGLGGFDSMPGAVVRSVARGPERA
jgi:predicted hydrocarbon binding protein